MDQQLDLDLPADEALADLVEGWSRRVRAHKTTGTIHPRRAASEARLREVLPQEFADGDHWHVLSAGDVDALSFAAHLLATRQADYMLMSTWHLATRQADYMLMSTWHLAKDDIERLHGWLADGTVRHCDAYVGEIFRSSYPTEYGALCSTLRPHGGRVATFRNHSKVFCIACGPERFTIESSANVNTNPRCENTVLTKDATLYAHHKRYFDEIHAFNAHEFPAWTARP